MMRTILRWLAAPLWTRYLAATHLMKLQKAGLLTAEAAPYAKVIVAVGLVLDCLYNLTWATVYFWDWPRELLVTQRLERYKYGRAYRLERAEGWDWEDVATWRLSAVEIRIAPATDWRLEETHWMEENMLDAADPTGHHLRPPA
jgi:hypothetical protein